MGLTRSLVPDMGYTVRVPDILQDAHAVAEAAVKEAAEREVEPQRILSLP